jgi:hypothetical protein
MAVSRKESGGNANSMGLGTGTGVEYNKSGSGTMVAETWSGLSDTGTFVPVRSLIHPGCGNCDWQMTQESCIIESRIRRCPIAKHELRSSTGCIVIVVIVAIVVP